MRNVSPEKLSVSVLCPTRGRPENLKRLHDSIKDTCRGPVALHVYCDEDDPRLGEYDIPHHTGPDYEFAMKCHILASSCMGHILMMCGDDAVFHTKHWDDALRECQVRYKDGIWCASFWDGTSGKPEEYDVVQNDKGENLQVPKPGTAFKTTHPHPAVTCDVFNTLGYVANPMFRHFSTDPWLTDMFKAIDRFEYIPKVRCDHLRAGLVQGIEEDSTHGKMRPNGKGWISERDRTVCHMFKKYQNLDIELLKLKMKEFDDV